MLLNQMLADLQNLNQVKNRFTNSQNLTMEENAGEWEVDNTPPQFVSTKNLLTSFKKDTAVNEIAATSAKVNTSPSPAPFVDTENALKKKLANLRIGIQGSDDDSDWDELPAPKADVPAPKVDVPAPVVVAAPARRPLPVIPTTLPAPVVIALTLPVAALPAPVVTIEEVVTATTVKPTADDVENEDDVARAKLAEIYANNKFTAALKPMVRKMPIEQVREHLALQDDVQGTKVFKQRFR